MKSIVLMQGMGLNERGWAKLISQYGRVLLIQQGFINHAERWENGICVEVGPEKNVSSTRFIDNLTFGLLTMWRTLRQTSKWTRGQKIDLIIAASYSMALVALWLRLVGKAQKVVCTVVDHLPQTGSFGLRIHRQIASWLTYITARWADEVWAISTRIPAIKFNKNSHVIRFSIDNFHTNSASRNEIGYIGFPTEDHGLDLAFDICRKHNIRLNVIGSSPYLESIKHTAPPQAVFHGQMNDKEKIKAILSRCFCGYSVYRMTGSKSYSYYGFPSKALYYFASDLPLLTTHTSLFTEQVEQLGLGRVVSPTAGPIESAILDLKHNYAEYCATITRFRENWNDSVNRFHQERISALLAKD